jgi:hypothetical protein
LPPVVDTFVITCNGLPHQPLGFPFAAARRTKGFFYPFSRSLCRMFNRCTSNASTFIPLARAASADLSHLSLDHGLVATSHSAIIWRTVPNFGGPDATAAVSGCLRLKPDFALDFDLPEIPTVGSYISIQRPEHEAEWGEDVVVRKVWWRPTYLSH